MFVKHRPPTVLYETLARSSPHLVHDETKSFGSIPSPHPLDAIAKKIKRQSIPNQQFLS